MARQHRRDRQYSRRLVASMANATSPSSASSHRLRLRSRPGHRPDPILDDSCDHWPDRFLVADIDLDPQGGATRRLDLGDSAVSGHVPLPRPRISYECALNRAFELFAPESQTGFQTVPGSWRKETAPRSG